MIWALVVITVLYWLAWAADVATTRGAIARNAGTESNRRYVDDRGHVRYGRNFVASFVTWGCGAVVALVLPFPFGAVGLVWIVVRGSFRAAAAIHNSKLM